MNLLTLATFYATLGHDIIRVTRLKGAPYYVLTIVIHLGAGTCHLW